MAITLGAGPTTTEPGGSSTSIVVTQVGCTAGRSLVIAASWAGDYTITSATCPGETVAIHGSAFGRAGIGNYQQLLSIANIQASGDKTVTINLSVSATNRCAYIVELVGGNTASWFDGVSTAEAASGATASVSRTTTNANAAIFTIGAHLSPAFSPGSGYTGIGTLVVYNYGEYDLDAGAAGAKTVDFSGSGSQAWSIIAASFNASPDPTAIFNLPVITLSATGGALGAVFNLPMLTIAAGNEGAEFNLPMLTLSATGSNAAQFNLPVITLVASGGPAAVLTVSGTAPAPTLVATLVPSALITSQLTAPAPTLVATILSGEAITFQGTAPAPSLIMSAYGMRLTAPAPTLVATLVSGTVITITATAPAPSLIATLDNPAIITAQNTAPAPRLLATLLAGNLLTFTGDARAPSLVAAGYAGEVITFTGSSPVPTMTAYGYPAYTLTFSGTAPAPTLDAQMAQAITAAFRTWVLNTRKGALTEYDNFAFNSFATFNGVVLACGAGGVVSLGTQDVDGATAITARVRTGLNDYGTSLVKRVPRIYLDGKQTGDLTFRTITSESGQRSYLLPYNHVVGTQQRRIPVGKGPKSKRWQFEVEGVAGADFSVNSVLVYPTTLRRRIM